MATTQLFLVLGGSVFFPFMFYFLIYSQRWIYKGRLDDATAYTIALRIVSTVQSAASCISGFIIISSCKDVLYDSHWLASTYVWFGVTYFYYDTWAMYVTHWYRHPELQELPALRTVRIFMQRQPLMMIHHLILPLIYLPIIVYFRRGVGDFFIGCFYCIELAIPCISLRAVLLKLGKEKSLLYAVNGVVLILTFATCRVLIFPFMYWSYGLQKELSILQVVTSIPKKCNIGCLLLLSLQVYWLYQMVAVFVRTVWTRWIRPALYPSEIKSS